VLWHPERKFFLLGTIIAAEMVRGFSPPKEMMEHINH